MDDYSEETLFSDSSPSSQESTTDIPGPSRVNPPKTPKYSFYLELKPARLPKLAIEALCDPKFNPSGKGKVDVDENVFNIKVLNPDNVVGFLYLLSEKVENYHCDEPVFRKLIDLQQISRNLVASNDEDTLIVLHEDGSNEISFSFGEEPVTEFAAEILENDVEMPALPHLEVICNALIESIPMSPLIDELVKNGNPQPVSVDLTKYTATVVVGQKRLDHNYKTMGYGDWGTLGLAEGGQRHHARFYWPYPGVMRKTLLLFHNFTVTLLRNPPNNILMRFMLPKLGQLVFLKEGNELIPDLDTFTIEPNLKEEQNTEAFAVVPN